MTKKPLRCAVIGTGAIGLGHVKSLVTHPQAAVVAIAETNADLANRVRRRFDIPHDYRDFEDLLARSDLDAVTVAVPNHLHAKVTLAALRAGKHVFLEKPMAMNLQEARRMAALSKKVGKTLMVGMNFRFRRETQAAKNAFESGRLGQVYHARCYWLRRRGIPRIGSWFTQKRLSGGGCGCDLAVHMIDLALYLLGDFSVRSVTAVTHDRLGSQGKGEMNWGKSAVDPAKPFDVEDYMVALLRLASGTSISLQIGWAGFHEPDQPEIGMDFFGDQGGLHLFPARLYRESRAGYETTELEPKRLPWPENRLHHFVDCVRRGGEPLVKIGEALRVQAIIDAIYRSARHKKEVTLNA